MRYIARGGNGRRGSRGDQERRVAVYISGTAIASDVQEAHITRLTARAAIHGRANGSLIAGYGYAGILVAFLARQSPLAIIPVSVLLGGIAAAGGLVQRRMGLPDATMLVFQGMLFVGSGVVDTVINTGQIVGGIRLTGAGSILSLKNSGSISPTADSGYTAETRMALPDDKWAIDGSMFTHNGQRWFVWSGWAGDTNVEQNLYNLRMTSPSATAV